MNYHWLVLQVMLHWSALPGSSLHAAHESFKLTNTLGGTEPSAQTRGALPNGPTSGSEIISVNTTCTSNMEPEPWNSQITTVSKGKPRYVTQIAAVLHRTSSTAPIEKKPSYATAWSPPTKCLCHVMRWTTNNIPIMICPFFASNYLDPQLLNLFFRITHFRVAFTSN